MRMKDLYFYSFPEHLCEHEHNRRKQNNFACITTNDNNLVECTFKRWKKRDGEKMVNDEPNSNRQM